LKIQKNFVDDLEPQDRVDGLARPVDDEIPLVGGVFVERVGNRKIYDLCYQEPAEDRELAINLAAP
jgi:hypothetical protein